MADVGRLDQGDGPGPRAGWGLLLGVLVLGLVCLLVEMRYVTPDPVPASAPPAQFSAGRAGVVLSELVGDGSPHPVGSPANARVRDRILARFRSLGYAPWVERGFACHPDYGCAAVENILARLDPPGSAAAPGAALGSTAGPGPAVRSTVLVSAHYDSVPAGPGASDDLTGVAAVLETARALKAGPPLKNPVLFLIDDGEEAGLLGAKAFAATPAAREVAAVVNLEARGTSGPSLMFETNRDNAWLIPLFAGATPRPMASSVFQTIYERMPNDTDFSIFKRAGMQGLNYAFIGDPTHYHSRLDNLANASPATLQHHGENTLGAARALAGADLARTPKGAAVFFDVLGLGVVHWPQGWTLPLAILVLALVLAATTLLVRRGAAGGGSVALGLLAWLLAVVATVAAAVALVALLRTAGVLRANWVAEPLPLHAAFWLLPLAAGGAVVAAFARRAAAAGLWAGVWIAWALAGLMAALTLPGLSFLFLVPALVAGAAGLALLAFKRTAGLPLLAALLPAAVAGLLWFPLAGFLYEGLGINGLLAVAVLVAAVVTTLAPLAAGAHGRRAVPLAAVALVVVAAIAATAMPTYSPDSPRRVNLIYHLDADAGSGRWLVSGDPPVPPAMRKFAEFSPQPPYPWSVPEARVPAAAAPRLDLAPPEVAVVEDRAEGGRRRLKLRLTSPRGAPAAMLFVPESAGVESARMGGVEVPRQRDGRLAGRAGWVGLISPAVPPAGIEIDLVLTGRARVSGFVADRSPGLPPAGRALAAARPADAMGDGDVIVVSRKVQL